MMGHDAAIPVLRFRAGPLGLAIAAEDVLAVAAPREGIPHIAAALGVEPAADAERREIHVVVSGDAAGEPREAVFQADSPFVVVPCHAADVIPIAPGFPQAGWNPVMGIAQLDGATILLLDIPGVIARLHASDPPDGTTGPAERDGADEMNEMNEEGQI